MSLIPYYFDKSPFNLLNPDVGKSDIFQPMGRFVPKELFEPVGKMFKRLDHLSSAMNHLAIKSSSKITSDSEKFEIHLDVQHFAPDEISVLVSNGVVTVKAKHDEKRDEHGYVSRQFIRSYTLPKECLPDTVESKLSSDGVLTVSAPKVIPLPSPGERIIPITHTGPVKKRIGTEN